MIHIFWPEMIQSSPSRRARVRIEPGSEPASGSVRPKQPIASPAAIRGSHSCFCSSEPQRQIANIASEPCTETRRADPRVARLELHAGEAVGGCRGAGAAVALEVHAEDVQRAEFESPARAGTVARLEPVADVRGDLVGDEGAHRVTDVALLVGEHPIDREEVLGARLFGAVVAVDILLRSGGVSIFESSPEDSRLGSTRQPAHPQHPRLIGRTAHSEFAFPLGWLVEPTPRQDSPV